MSTEATRAAVVRRIGECLDRGVPWQACDTFRDALAQHADDGALLFAGALANARAGSTGEAHRLIDRALSVATSPAQRVEMLRLRGRLFKDALHAAYSAEQAHALALRARDQYRAAYAIAQEPFPGINCATLSLLVGDRAAAESMARSIEASLTSQRRELAGWDLLTAAEAALLCGNVELARERYAAAWSASSRDAGRIATVRRQLRLIARALPEAARLLDVMRAPDVIAFTGHMIDAPDRAVPRFPPDLEPAVDAALRERVKRWHAPVVFSSAASGADILMLEAALDAQAETDVVLPFDRDEFLRTSVAPAGERWVSRFDAVLARASRVIVASHEGFLGDEILFEHASLQLEGLALLRAAQLETEPTMVAVVEGNAEIRPGGTGQAVARWRRAGGAVDAVDLAVLRGSHPEAAAVGGARETSHVASGTRRSLQSMLFADIAGYSRLKDAQVPRFQRWFWDLAASELAALSSAPRLANTWGDAVFVVFDDARDAASFALRLRDRIAGTDWTAVGLPASLSIRIALHAAAVFAGDDPILGRENFFGAGVTRAARIEPVTPPGAVYASEAFAATLAASRAPFSLQYVGTLDLAKHYGESRVYRLEAR